MIRVADYVMNKLYNTGCKDVFMVTGRGILYLSDAVARHEQMNAVCVHHEQAASYAAYAYAQCKEGMGACLISTGCAGTNAMTGLLCAWQDNVPCIFISGQNMLHQTSYYTGIPLRTYGSQEANIVELVKPVTKYAVMITNPEDIAYEMEKAIHIAQTGRMGPVWIDIPLDIQNMRIDSETIHHYEEKEDIYRAAEPDYAQVVQLLEEATRPVLFIGGGIRSAKAIGELREFLKKLPMPVVFSASAVDTYGTAEELSIGAVGSLGGSRAGNFAVQNADLVLAIGNRLSPMTTGEDGSKFAREAKIIVVDIDSVEHSKDIVKIDKFIQSDAKEFLKGITLRDIHGNYEKWIATCKHWKAIFPKCEEQYKGGPLINLYHLADCVSRHLAEDAVFLSDAGFEELIFPATIDFKCMQRCIHPVSQGAMGFALPASVGAYYAKGKQVVCVNGDGSIMMNLQELQTICHNNIPIKILVCNNNCYAVIRKRQQDLFRTRTIGTDDENGVSCPEFFKIAQAFGMEYVKISTVEELDSKMEYVMNCKKPIICEVMCVTSQEYLHNSYGRNKNGKMVRRSLEDQSPFIDRDLFEKEMIIKTLE